MDEADGSGRSWLELNAPAAGRAATGITSGCAGVILALAEIVSELNDPTHRAVLADAARWLKSVPDEEGAPRPGLYVGEGGISAALLRCGQVLHGRSLVAVAAERGRRVATMPYQSSDLSAGTAGRARVHLWLYGETGDLSHLEDAIDAGDVLLKTARRSSNGSITWTGPNESGTLADPLGTGYAHGLAGVADSLLDLHEASGDARYLKTARDVARWLARLAVPIVADGSGLGWPEVAGQAAQAGFWCQGAPGIGRFFIHAAQLELIPEARSIALGAARTTATAGRFAGPARCHGLTGNIETLLDVYQATGEAIWLRHAREIAHLVDTYAVVRDGHPMYGGDAPNVYSPTYMVGYGGVAVTLLRLAAPDRLPHQLSQRGFRRQPPASGPQTAVRGGEIIV